MSDLATRTSLHLRRLPTDRVGVDARSRYVDHFWMPTIGPVAVTLARVLMRMLSRRGEMVHIELDHLRAILGPGADAPADLEEAVGRLEGVDILARSGDSTLFVRPDFPKLTDPQIAALPEALATAHRAPSSLAAANLETVDGHIASPGPHARALSLVATVEEILVNPSLDPAQLARRWQHVLRLAEEARDDALLDWAPGDLEATLAEAQLAGQAIAEAMWATQQCVVTRRSVGGESRAALTDAAAGIIDWLVAEFPEDVDPNGSVDLDDL